MSARNYLSAREKNYNKIIDCLPDINRQKFSYRPSQDLPVLSANTSGYNRNLKFSYDTHSYLGSSSERGGTPFSDFFSESEAGTPDFRSEESDSSSGSALRQSTAEATKILKEEWDRIERTLYNEEGEKCMRPQIIEECQQWRHLHPQLRIIGRALPLPERRISYKQMDYDEVIAMHYSDYEQFSETDERLSQSSTDVTPQNSPRVSIAEDLCEPKLFREKVTCYPNYDDELSISESFCSLLQISPIHIHSPLQRNKQNTSILKSEIASSKWMKNSRPDSSMNLDRGSAKSFVSLDMRNYGNLALSASDRNKLVNGRVVTAKHRDAAKLEPLYTPTTPNQDFPLHRVPNMTQQLHLRKVSLPPLLLEAEKKKVSSVQSAKKLKSRKSASRGLLNLNKTRQFN